MWSAKMRFLDTTEITRAIEFVLRKQAMPIAKDDESMTHGIFHLIDVGRTLFEATEGEDAGLVVAGLLHHVLATEHTTLSDVTNHFGLGVSELAEEVSDLANSGTFSPSWSGHASVSGYSHRAKMLAIADSTSTLNIISRWSPSYLEVDRRPEYFDGCLKIVDRCRGLNSVLEQHFDSAYAKRIEIESAKLTTAF